MNKKINLIAETAWHHDGDLNFFKKLVTDTSEKTDADFVKFHITLDLDEYMYMDHSAYKWAQERIFTENEWSEILNIPPAHNKKLMLLFNDKKAIDFGMRYNPELVEIHSVCLNDINLLIHLNERITKKTKVVLGIGGSDLSEVENSIKYFNSDNIVLMHGFQNFPTSYKDINFGKISRIIQLFQQFEHGYADHTEWSYEHNILITLIGAALGVKYLEKHITNVPGQERTDWQSAISIEMFQDLSIKLDVVSDALGDRSSGLNLAEKSCSTYGINKKAAILIKPVTKGDMLTEDCFRYKRTSQMSDLSQIKIIERLGNKFTRSLEPGHCILTSDIE